MKAKANLERWILDRVAEGIFETPQDGYEIMAMIGIELCRVLGLHRDFFKKIPLSVSIFDEDIWSYVDLEKLSKHLKKFNIEIGEQLFGW